MIRKVTVCATQTKHLHVTVCLTNEDNQSPACIQVYCIEPVSLISAVRLLNVNFVKLRTKVMLIQIKSFEKCLTRYGFPLFSLRQETKLEFTTTNKKVVILKLLCIPWKCEAHSEPVTLHKTQQLQTHTSYLVKTGNQQNYQHQFVLHCSSLKQMKDYRKDSSQREFCTAHFLKAGQQSAQTGAISLN